jgi:large subunit ribosomal protein L20
MIPKKLVLELAKGFRGRSKNCISIARERVEKALQYAYRSVNRIDSCVAYSPAYRMFCNLNISIINDHPRDRRVRRRDLRSQWIQQINAGTIVTPCSPLNI